MPGVVEKAEEKEYPPAEALMSPGRYFQGFLLPSGVPMLFHNGPRDSKLQACWRHKSLNDNHDGPRDSMLGMSVLEVVQTWVNQIRKALFISISLCLEILYNASFLDAVL